MSIISDRHIVPNGSLSTREPKCTFKAVANKKFIASCVLSVGTVTCEVGKKERKSLAKESLEGYSPHILHHKYVKGSIKGLLRGLHRSHTLEAVGGFC